MFLFYFLFFEFFFPPIPPFSSLIAWLHWWIGFVRFVFVFCLDRVTPGWDWKCAMMYSFFPFFLFAQLGSYIYFVSLLGRPFWFVLVPFLIQKCTVPTDFVSFLQNFLHFYFYLASIFHFDSQFHQWSKEKMSENENEHKLFFFSALTSSEICTPCL